MKDSKAHNGSPLTLFQVAFVFSIAFSASVKGSVIKMKPSAPVLENNMEA